MIEVPSTRDDLKNLFYYFAHCYNGKLLPKLEAICQFVLTEGKDEYAYYLSIKDQKAQSYEGKHNCPDVNIKAHVDNFFAILNGSLNPYIGFLFGKFRIEGSLFCLLRLKSLFGKRFDGSCIPALREYENLKQRWIKPKKVLIINSSPRRREGYTYFYLSSFVDGIHDAGCETEIIDLYDDGLSIESCRGCFSCFFKTEGRCIIDDQAKDLVEKIEMSDLIIFAFPLYFVLFPDKLMALLDRCLVLLSPYCEPFGDFTRHPRRNPKAQYMAIFSTSAWPGLKQFNVCKDAFQLISKAIHIELISSVLRPAGIGLLKMVTYRVFLKDVLRDLRSAGRELVEDGRITRKALAKIAKPYTSVQNCRNNFNLYFYAQEKDGLIKD